MIEFKTKYNNNYLNLLYNKPEEYKYRMILKNKDNDIIIFQSKYNNLFNKYNNDDEYNDNVIELKEAAWGE